MCDLKSVSALGFDLPGDELTVTFGCESFKTHKTTGAVGHVVQGIFDSIFVGSQIEVHLLKETLVVSGGLQLIADAFRRSQFSQVDIADVGIIQSSI